ncbi:MAG: hypothetical protein QN193_01785 [Armatimonadota bacterium]|nr:hypothetical protein [Armatimonadota bacterium]MDR7443480.1 hypothetical protein [Armatimonadota bacterium]MDR7569319.1 hypothetical protein [Armatimonadota bacterium]MDR7614979.1 hypothetical protein [Armatimonadota bacterium]
MTFEQHADYRGALLEIERLRRQLAALPGLERHAREEATRLASEAFEQALSNARGTDRALLAAQAAEGRVALIERHRPALEARLAELEAAVQGRLKRANVAHVAAQAEPRRLAVLRRFVEEVRPAVEALLAEAAEIERAVAAAGGRPDPFWTRPIEDALSAVKSAEERLERSGGL